MSSEQLARANELIQQKRYSDARAILQTVDHPMATEWLHKLDSIEAQDKPKRVGKSKYVYPLNLRFKLVSFTPQIYITDAQGNDIVYVRQKLLKLKEDVRIYRDDSKTDEVFRIGADRIIDFSARYHFYESATDTLIGSVKRKGMRSLWKSTYFIDSPNDITTHHIKEDSAWTKVGDALLSEIPIVGMFTGYFLNPSYTVYKGDNREDERFPVMRLVKQAAFWEGRFEIEQLDESMSPQEEQSILLSLMMLVQLERRRG